MHHSSLRLPRPLGRALLAALCLGLLTLAPRPAAAHARLMQQQAAMEAASRQAKKSSAGTDMVLGLILCVVGIAITVGTYDSASRSGGGTYFIAYGPIIYGAIRFFKGLVNLGG